MPDRAECGTGTSSETRGRDARNVTHEARSPAATNNEKHHVYGNRIRGTSDLGTAAMAMSYQLNGLAADGGVAIANVDFPAISRVSLRAIDVTASDGARRRLRYKGLPSNRQLS